uniref:TRAPPC10/Trs130 C-terminal domain-containing protein n=1 Tax=Amphimedon queenslandica TaxID=400682 RepID=A0A1X7UXK6_AMPQE
METVYHLKAAVEPVLPLQPISLNQHVYIIYTISNITRGFRDSTHQPHSLQIHYAIQPDSTQWLIKMPKKGVVSAPGIANSSSFKVMAMPLEEGYLTIPTCSLMIERVDGGGGEGEGGGKRSLTSSQCYDTTLHQYIKVGSAGQPF